MSSAARILTERIGERADRAGRSVTPSEIAQLARYYELLARWNRVINLTALPLEKFPDRTIDRLLIEPLFIADEVSSSAGEPLDWLDFGSGGGSPAIPLKVVRPRLRLTMVEAKERKAAFLREVISTLVLSDTMVLTTRFEKLADTGFRATADIVTVRAVRIDDGLLDSVAAVLRPGGRILLARSRIALIFNDLRFGLRRDVEIPALDFTLSVLEKSQ